MEEEESREAKGRYGGRGRVLANLSLTYTTVQCTSVIVTHTVYGPEFIKIPQLVHMVEAAQCQIVRDTTNTGILANIRDV